MIVLNPKRFLNLSQSFSVALQVNAHLNMFTLRLLKAEEVSASDRKLYISSNPFVGTQSHFFAAAGKEADYRPLLQPLNWKLHNRYMRKLHHQWGTLIIVEFSSLPTRFTDTHQKYYPQQQLLWLGKERRGAAMMMMDDVKKNILVGGGIIIIIIILDYYYYYYYK